MQERKIQYFDSMSGSGVNLMRSMQRYLRDEAFKNGRDDYREPWAFIDNEKSSPKQDNCCDCGVFAILTAIFIVLALPLTHIKPGAPITNARRHMTHLLLNLSTVLGL